MKRLATAALNHWDIEVSGMNLVMASENIVYRVDTSAGDSYALRIHRPGYHSMDELLSENQWTSALSSAGISVPRPYATKSGSAYLTIALDSSSETRVVGLSGWMSGRQLEEAIAARDRDPLPLFTALGVLLGQLHNHAAQWIEPSGFTRHSLDAQGLIGENPWWSPFWNLREMSALQSSTIIEARDRLRLMLNDYGKSANTFGLTHADLVPQNVLVNGDQLVAIDFDDAAYGWHQYDIATALVEFIDDTRFSEFQSALLAGYRRTRPITDAALGLLPIFLLIRQLVNIGWTGSRVQSHFTDAAGVVLTRTEILSTMIPAVVTRCKKFLDSAMD